MRRTAFFSLDQESLVETLDELEAASQPGASGFAVTRRSRKIERSDSGNTMRVPLQRWKFGSGKELVSWGDAKQRVLKRGRHFFKNVPDGYVAFVANTHGDVKEIVFIHEQKAYKRMGENLADYQNPQATRIAWNETQAGIRFAKATGSFLKAAFAGSSTSWTEMFTAMDAVEKLVAGKKRGAGKVNL